MIEQLKQWVLDAKRIVFFGGAGVSTESGIPDFRGVDGLYRQKYAYPPEEILSHGFFMRHPEEFYRFYRDKMLITGAKPNAAHLTLARWEREGKLTAVVTQTIDGLHSTAGSDPDKCICPAAYQFFHCNCCRRSSDSCRCHTDFLTIQHSRISRKLLGVLMVKQHLILMQMVRQNKTG